MIWLSLMITIVVTVASLLGLVTAYPYARETANWALQARGQDIGNLLTVPAFLASLYYLKKGSSGAFLIWMGILFYYIYAYLIYAFFVHFNNLFLMYVGVLGLSVYVLISGLINVNFSEHLISLSGTTKRFASWLLIVIGVLFAMMWFAEIINALALGENTKSAVEAGLLVNPVHVIDLAIVLPGMIITGIMLIKDQLFGYLFTAPWLTFSVFMGSSICATLIMELLRNNREAIPPLVIIGFLVVFSLGVLGAYFRDVNKKIRKGQPR